MPTLLVAVLATQTVLAAERKSEVGGYLFVTFRGESTPMAEQIYLGISRDGRTWEALNKGEPVLISNLGEKGVRDPYLLRSHDGRKFFLLATDLSVHFNGNWRRAVRTGSRSIVIWESEDLVKWSEPRLVKVAPDDAGCAWAPQAIFDESTGDYLVYWASTTSGDRFRKHRIWASRTSDFKTFGKPFVYIEQERTIIDTDIISAGENPQRYFRFTKDEQTKAITMETSGAITGQWNSVPGFSLADMRGYEGPACFQLKSDAPNQPGEWCLLLDYYTRGQGYKAWTTTDLASGEFTPADSIKFPFRFRHGSVLALSEAEFDRVHAAYSAK